MLRVSNSAGMAKTKLEHTGSVPHGPLRAPKEHKYVDNETCYVQA